MAIMLVDASIQYSRNTTVKKGSYMNTDRTIAPDRTAVDLSLLIIRVIVGVIFMAHGSQKMFGAFEGKGLEATVQMMGSPLGYLVAVGEFFGGVGLVFGFLSRFSAASIIVIMGGAIAMVHGKKGFFLEKGGFEYNLALIGLLLPILICGPGRFSIGKFFLPKSSRTAKPLIVLE
jgi:putative oxidoreductase